MDTLQQVAAAMEDGGLDNAEARQGPAGIGAERDHGLRGRREQPQRLPRARAAHSGREDNAAHC